MANFPTLNGGVLTQLPSTYGMTYLLDQNEGDQGQAFAYYRRANPVRFWQLSFGAITRAEWVTLRDFFLTHGSHESFTLTDPADGTTAYTVLFDQQALEARWIDDDVVATSVRLVEVVS